jgi:hypothetical protein
LDVDEGEQLRGRGYSKLAGCRAGGCGDVGKALNEPIESGLAIIDGVAFVIGERDDTTQPTPAC